MRFYNFVSIFDFSATETRASILFLLKLRFCVSRSIFRTVNIQNTIFSTNKGKFSTVRPKFTGNTGYENLKNLFLKFNLFA